MPRLSALASALNRAWRLTLPMAVPNLINVSYVTTGGTKVTTFNIPTPTGTLEGHLMVALVVTDANANPAWNAPGWQVGLSRPTAPSLAIFWKFATASEPANQTFNFPTTTAKLTGQIWTYENAQFGRVSSLIGPQVAAQTPVLSTPDLAPGVAFTTLVTSSSSTYWTNFIGNQPTWADSDSAGCSWGVTAAPFAASVTAVGGADFTTNGGAGSAQTLGITWSIVSSSLVLPEPVSLGFTSGYTSLGTTLTIDHPPGAVQGDLLVAVMGFNGTCTWIDGSGGYVWTEVADQGANPSVRIAWKYVNSTIPASYNFNSSASGFSQGFISAYRDASFDKVSAFAPMASPIVIPSVAVRANNSKLVSVFWRNSASETFTTPAGMTPSTPDSDSFAPSDAVFSQTVQAGATGTRTSTNSTGGTTGIAGISYVVAPAI